MIAGVNRIFEHEGREFHIQVEDLGEKQASFEVRVHPGGGTVWQKRMSYAATLARGLPKADQDEEIGTNLRFSWLRTANTGFYIVYNEVNERGVGALPTGRELILKYSYMFDVFN